MCSTTKTKAWACLTLNRNILRPPNTLTTTNIVYQPRPRKKKSQYWRSDGAPGVVVVAEISWLTPLTVHDVEALQCERHDAVQDQIQLKVSSFRFSLHMRHQKLIPDTHRSVPFHAWQSEKPREQSQKLASPCLLLGCDTCPLS